MRIMHKRKCMREFSLAISVESLRSNLLAKLLMHNCERAKHAKTCKFSVRLILQA